MNPRAEPSAAKPTSSANDRLKQSFGAWLWGGIVMATVVHFGVFSLWPQLQASDISVKADEVRTINLPPEVQIPPPPSAIARPALPVIATASVDRDVTIAKTSFEFNKVENLPPPPKQSTEADLARAPVFTPYTVAPSILNRAEVVREMLTAYPSVLRDAGIGGTVTVWFFIDERGTVVKHQIYRSSGHPELDSAAVKVADVYRFSAAVNRDKRVPVWVQIPIIFEVQ